MKDNNAGRWFLAGAIVVVLLGITTDQIMHNVYEPSSTSLRASLVNASGTPSPGGGGSAGTSNEIQITDNSGGFATYAGGNCVTVGNFSTSIDGAGTLGCTAPYSVGGTQTNTAFDAENTGNQITLPSKLAIISAMCAGATAASGWDMPASGGAVPVCDAGTNTHKAYLKFEDSGTEAAYYHFELPTDWAGTVNVEGKWLTSATSGDVVFQLQTACVPDGSTADPSWNTVQKITDAAKGSANEMNDFALTPVTMTGCNSGDTWYIKFFRDPSDGGDTLGADALLDTVMFTVRRTIHGPP